MNDKKKRGRPTLKTQDRMDIILDALRKAMPMKRACEFAMLDPTTVYRWMEKDKDFAAKANYSKAHAIQALIVGVAKKDPWKLLKNLDSEHFKEHLELELTPPRRLVITAKDQQKLLAD